MSSRTDPDRWRESKRILDLALERPYAERAAFIAEACGNDAALRRDVESLAAASDDTANILDEPVPVPFEDLPPRSRVGERIGAYELIEELGRGGMGVVYLARRADDEFQQKVAIKLVSGGLSDELALDRFRSERQIAASLGHPHIARLLDGGTTEAGEPYFVMEYVEGEPLLEYCEKRRLSFGQRLKIFQDVCAAVQHAHQRLVVHRDLKPGNILVTAKGEAKLLDFGIAKMLAPDGVDRVGDRTATLYRMLTPDYASPEQVRGQAVTTASDVYALGVVLYELLAGRRPYHVVTPEPAELLRLVCEQDPEKPSTVAQSRELRGDLDAIVARAMRKEPGRRYSSAAALSDDIGHHLDGRPVFARRGTTVYRAGKFMRRHRFGVAAAAVVGLALAGGVWATLREARRARAAEATAQRRFNDVRKLANSFLNEFHDAIRDLPGSTPARQLLVQRGLEYLDGLSREAAGDVALRRELAQAYMKVGDVQGNPFVGNLGDLAGALASYRKAIGLLEPAAASGRAGEEERATLATAYLVGGGIQFSAGDPAAAVAMARKGLALRRELAAAHPGDARRQLDLAQGLQFLAFDLSGAGQGPEAAAVLQEQTAILRERQQADPGNRAVRRSLGQNLYLIGETRGSAGDRAGARKAYLEAAQVQKGLADEDPGSVTFRRDLAYSEFEIANVDLNEGNQDEALERYGSVLRTLEGIAAADPRSVDAFYAIGMIHHNSGRAHLEKGRRDTALSEYAAARVAYERLLAAAPSNDWVRGMLGRLHLAVGKLLESRPESGAAACENYRKGVEILERLSGTAGLLGSRQEELETARKAAAAACAGPRGEGRR